MRDVVLHVVEAFDGGVATFIESLVESKELSRYEHVITYGPRSNLDRLNGLNVSTAPWPSARRALRPFADVRALLELGRTIRALRPALIHCHSSKAGFLGRIAAAFFRRTGSVIYTPHGVAFLRRDVSRINARLFALAEVMMARASGCVVACSDSEGAALRRYGIQSITIANGVSLPISLPPRSSHEEGRVLQVVTVGRLTTQKNPDLFNAIASHFANDSRIRFTWIGDGEMRAHISQNAAVVTGWMPSQEVRSFLTTAHVYLSTSDWEGLPLAVLEAMAHGLPVILSRCVGNVDLAAFGNGFLFDTQAEAVEILEWCLARPEALIEMGEASRFAVADSLNVGRMAAEYNQLYSRLRGVNEQVRL